MKGFREKYDRIWQAYSGEAAWQIVADLSRFHRIQASPGYRQAAQLVYELLVREGLEAETLSYPANEETSFWAWASFQEWDCNEATLRLVEPGDGAKAQLYSLGTVLADFRASPMSLIQRSIPFEGEAEVVLLEDGVKESDYDGLDVAGKVVLSSGDIRRVWELAVEQRDAIGILFDGMRVVSPVRPEGDLANIRQYTSFWWRPGDTRCFGFVLTPRQGQALRRLLKGGDAPVRIHARVDSRLYDGALEVVQATIPGESQDEILVVAHLCHPKPSANDNASGAAAALEAARSLQALIANGDLARPKRTIRFLWMPEMTGTFAYLSDREAELDHFIAGINLDMVGEDQSQTGSSWLIERPPEAAASFTSDLLAHLRDELPTLKNMTDVSQSHTGVGAIPLYHQTRVPFSGGSDHYILSDPSVGVPTPMLIQWPDRFYHTAADTPDRTDPQSLARAGSLAAAYAYWLATAGGEEATWLGYEMMARFKVRLSQTSQAAVTKVLHTEEVESLARSIADLDRRLAYLLDRQKAALGTLEWLAPLECPMAELYAEATRATNHELAWARGIIDLHAATLGVQVPTEVPANTLSDEEQQAAALIPARQVRGPIPLQQHLRQVDDQARATWLQLIEEHKDSAHHTLAELASYWADGTRSVLDIADLVELETGERDVGLLLAYFQLVAKMGFVKFR
jgi:aminopeptidase-like protein